MAKSQKHSNREAKKPKQVKIAGPAAAAEGLLSRVNQPPSASNKKRS
jgi:hypothetical protein